MKILCKNLRSNLIPSFALLALVAASSVSLAKDVAMVTETRGKTFAMKDGKLWELKGSENISDFSEITTEEGGQVTLSDNVGNKFHLSGSGHIKILNRLIELKRGYLWVQASRPGQPISVQTANSQSDIESAEAIISFDSVTGKSQVLTVTGEVNFSNILEAHLKLVLGPGQFSFVDAQYEKGVPRKPTPVGYTSFKKIVGLFSGVKPMEKNEKLFPEKTANPAKAANRAIASVIEMEEAPANENTPANINEAIANDPQERPTLAVVEAMPESVRPENQKGTPGKVIILKDGNEYKSVASQFSAKKFLDKKIEVIQEKKRLANPYRNKTAVNVRIFGLGKSSVPARSLASVVEAGPVSKAGKKKAKKAAVPLVMAPENYREPAETQRPVLEPFEKSLLQEYKYQMRHSNEVKDLIEELKSYDKDFKKDF